MAQAHKGMDSHGSDMQENVPAKPRVAPMPAEGEYRRCRDGKEFLLDEYEELIYDTDWVELSQQILAVFSTIIALGLMVNPDLFRYETLVYCQDFMWEIKKAVSWVPEPSAAGGKAARQEWIIWKATAYKVLLFAAILVVIAALEQELMELLELFMALRSRDLSGSRAHRGGLDMSLVPQALLERWRARVAHTQSVNERSAAGGASAPAGGANQLAAAPSAQQYAGMVRKGGQRGGVS